MSAPAPSFFGATLAVTRFAALRHLRSRRTWIAVAATLLLIVAVAISRRGGTQTATAAWESSVRIGLLSFVCYVIPFLFHASSFSEEHEDRTLTYLLTRPLSRASIVLGKYLAGAAFVLTIGLLTTVVLYVATYAGSFDLAPDGALGKTCLAVACLGLGHGAIATSWSTTSPEHATPITVVHYVLGSLAPTKLPAVLPLLSLHQNAADVAGLPRVGYFASGVVEIPYAASLGVIAFQTVFFLALAIILASGREYRFARS